MKVLIVAGGAPVEPNILRKLVDAAERIIAADSGGEVLKRLNITPTSLVGDLDSITQETLGFFRGEGVDVVPLFEQDTTDLEKSIKLALRWGAKQITITCITGLRSDHFLHALGLLVKYRHSASLEIIDDTDVIRLLWSPQEFECAPGERISFIPWGEGITEEVTTRGLLYPLFKDDMSSGRLESVSNQTAGSSFSISFKAGMLLIIRPVSAILRDDE